MWLEFIIEVHLLFDVKENVFVINRDKELIALKEAY